MNETFSQSNKIDSLLPLVKTGADDTIKTNRLHALCLAYQSAGDLETALSTEQRTLALALKLKWKKGQSKAYHSIGITHYYLGNYPDAMKNYREALQLRKELNDKYGMAFSYNNIGAIYTIQANYPEALQNYFASLKLREEIGDKKGIADCYNNIGHIYWSQANYSEALKNHFAALKIRTAINDRTGIANSYNNIANTYIQLGNYTDAFTNHNAALQIRIEIGDQQGIAASYNNIGLIHYQLALGLQKQGAGPDSIREELHKALKNYSAALPLQEQIGDKDGKAATLVSLGLAHNRLQKTREGKNYFNQAIAIAKEIGSNQRLKEAYFGLVVLDSLVGDYRSALAHNKLFIAYRDSIDNAETKKKTIQNAMQYEFEKKELRAKAEQDKLDALNAEERSKQRIIIYSVAGVLLLVIVFSVFLYKRFRVTTRQKKIIEHQKLQVDKAYESLHERNKEVLDSIYYARRIQRSLLTSEKYIAKRLARLLGIFMLCTSVFAQNSKSDSLLRVMAACADDTSKVKLCHELFMEFEYTDTAKAGNFARKALELARQLDYKKGLGTAYMQLGFFADDRGDYAEALKNHFASLKVRTEMGSKKGMADSYTCLGIVYDNQGNYPEALKMHFTALKLYEAIDDKDHIADAYNNIGVVYDEQGNYPEALKNHLASLKFEQVKGDKEGIANSYINIGIIHERQHNYTEALKFYFSALELLKETNNKINLAHCYNNMGVVYHDLGNYSEALKDHFLALQLREEIGHKPGVASSCCNIGFSFIKLKDFKKAGQYLLKAEKTAKEVGSKENLKFIYRYLADMYEEAGDHKAAFESHKLFILYKDSLDNEETRKKTVKNALTYEFEKKELAAKARQDITNALSAEEKQKQSIIIYAVAGTLLIVLVFSLFLFGRFKIAQKQKGIIEKQKVLVDRAYESLHEKNKEIMDSIFYARRIQSALITSERYIERILKKNNS